MCKICDYFEAVKDDAVKMEEMENIVCDAMEMLKVLCPAFYKEIKYELHTIAYGEHFTQELAEHMVSKYKNIDGTTGEHWNKQLTDQYANNLGVIDKYDMYVLMNNYYSDFANVLGTDANIYAKMAKAMIEDPDACCGHVLRMYMLK